MRAPGDPGLAPHASNPQPRDQRGSSEALGLVLLTPVLLAAAIALFWISRLVDTQAQVHSVAEAAAQAAALQRGPAEADSAARELVGAMLASPDVCARLDVAVDLEEFGPGGRVRVEVVCLAAGKGRESLVASPREIRARAQVRMDRFREVGSAPVYRGDRPMQEVL